MINPNLLSESTEKEEISYGRTLTESGRAVTVMLYALPTISFMHYQHPLMIIQDLQLKDGILSNKLHQN